MWFAFAENQPIDEEYCRPDRLRLGARWIAKLPVAFSLSSSLVTVFLLFSFSFPSFYFQILAFSFFTKTHEACCFLCAGMVIVILISAPFMLLHLCHLVVINKKKWALDFFLFLFQSILCFAFGRPLYLFIHLTNCWIDLLKQWHSS